MENSKGDAQWFIWYTLSYSLGSLKFIFYIIWTFDYPNFSAKSPRLWIIKVCLYYFAVIGYIWKCCNLFFFHPTLWFAFTALVAMCFSKCRRSVILSLRLQDSLAAKLYTYLLQNVNKESVIYLYLRAKEYSIISCRFMCCIHHAGLFIKLLRRWLCTHCNYKSIIHHFF